MSDVSFIELWFINMLQNIPSKEIESYYLKKLCRNTNDFFLIYSLDNPSGNLPTTNSSIRSVMK